MPDPRPTLSGLDAEQRQLVTAWCALYAALPHIGNTRQAEAAILLVHMREGMTGTASKACALWERRHWRQRNG